MAPGPSKLSESTTLNDNADDAEVQVEEEAAEAGEEEQESEEDEEDEMELDDEDDNNGAAGSKNNMTPRQKEKAAARTAQKVCKARSFLHQRLTSVAGGVGEETDYEEQPLWS